MESTVVPAYPPPRGRSTWYSAARPTVRLEKCLLNRRADSELEKEGAQSGKGRDGGQSSRVL